MRSREEIASIVRVSNGWIVFEHHPGGDREVLCMTWEAVETVVRYTAFPYPDKTEPRGPTA